MKKLIITWMMLAALSCPVASRAGGIDIPALGVHIGVNIVHESDNSPVDPDVIRRFDGDEASLPMGTATLRIERAKDSVTEGSDIRDASFRTALQAHLAHEWL
jgi:hypothetical protein